MRKTSTLILLLAAQAAFGQSGVGVGEAGGGGMAGIWFRARVAPASSRPWKQTFQGGWNTNIINSYCVAHRFFSLFFDDAQKVFFGYDLLIQAQGDGFRVSFLELGIGPLDLPGTKPRQSDRVQPRADGEGENGRNCRLVNTRLPG
jgi:hypothetical protein